MEESVALSVPHQKYISPLTTSQTNEVQTTYVETFGVCCVRCIGYLGRLDLEDSAAINRRGTSVEYIVFTLLLVGASGQLSSLQGSTCQRENVVCLV